MNVGAQKFLGITQKTPSEGIHVVAIDDPFYWEIRVDQDDTDCLYAHVEGTRYVLDLHGFKDDKVRNSFYFV